MTDLIFVYGSLMRKVPSAASKWLAQHAIFVAEDTVQGELFDVGRYPGLVLRSNPDQLVFGEVFRLKMPADALQYLDQYEGTELTQPEYERLICQTEQGHQCWLYQFLSYQQAYPLIASGDYSTYYPTNPRHLAFIGRSDASTSN